MTTPTAAPLTARPGSSEVPPDGELPSEAVEQVRAIETDSGAGSSVQREYTRRRAARRARAKARYGALGSVLSAIAGDPASVQAWRQGAEGEIATARALAWRLHRSDVVLLHDRRIPGRGRANIDHIAIGPGGVTVIDSKSSRGTVQLGSAGINQRHRVLLINGRDRTSQLNALERQITRVAAALRRHGVGDVGVLGALCFPFMRRSWLHASRARDGLITFDDPAHIAKLANRPGRLLPTDIEQLADTLASAFPPAV